ncbi:MAG: discoidin domain-containing protein [Rhodothermales bacterium]
MRLTALTFLIAAAALTAAPPASAQSDYRIGIRSSDGRATFYDKQTNRDFIPRGNNYTELRADPTNSFLISSLFYPAYHDPVEIESDFERMHALGYNTARVFVDLCRDDECIANTSSGLNSAYMDNIVELLEIAKRNEVFVLLIANWLPDLGGYSSAHQTCQPNFYGGNCLLLSAEGVDGYRRFFRDLVQGLLDRDAPMDIVFGFEIRNEAFLENNQPPLNLSSGLITTANGMTYDMSVPAEKEQLIQDGFIYWANETRAAIREVTPNAIVTAGFFAPSAPYDWRPGDWRVVRTNGVLRDSDLDFLDFHLYQEPGLTPAQQAENFGMTGYDDKPIIMGEFGIFRHQFATSAPAADVLETWQADACAAGFDGYLLWQWDPIDSPLVTDNVYGPHDGNGEIARALAPVFHPDPCADNVVRNLAAGKPATASASLGDAPPSNATDGNYETGWGSGDFPEQWIEIDLGQPETIARLALLVDQFPAGGTIHQVYGRAVASDANTLLHEFSGGTEYGQWLEVSPEPAWENVRYLRVVTTSSPSWVSWFEIEAYGPDTRTFIPLPPALATPLNFTSGLPASPTLEWDAVADATNYTIQVARDDAFTDVVVDESAVAGTTLTLDPLANNENYYWRASASSGDATGPWSAVRKFTVGTTVGIDSDADGAADGDGNGDGNDDANADATDDADNSLIRSHSVYPNPFAASTNIRFELAADARVRVVVHDVLGREVAVLSDSRMYAGEHELQWAADGHARGVYFVRIEAGNARAFETVVVAQ